MRTKIEATFNNFLVKVTDLLHEDLAAMNSIINASIINTKLSLIKEIILHLLESGGKRLRAIVVLLICKIFNKAGEDKVFIAAAIEFIHNATLLHDDVIDESDTRRGEQTSNIIWGNKASILVGDFLLTMAFQWAIKCNNLLVIKVLSNASSKIVEGEIKQMSDIGNVNITQEQYINMISLKTASLFSAACESAAIISNTSIAEQLSMSSFGNNLGIAFQIVDDILDYKILQQKFSENPGNDFYNRKITLPIIICINESDQEEKYFWNNKLYNDENNFKKALEYIKKHDAINKSIKIADYYAKLANKSLDILPNSEYKKLLIELSKCLVYRNL